ncbi:MAG: hypothetical protein KKH98_09855 [Spirochaetes bacterium]|nr:hypothetical protein [Spirochaetota bacterium]
MNKMIIFVLIIILPFWFCKSKTSKNISRYQIKFYTSDLFYYQQITTKYLATDNDIKSFSLQINAIKQLSNIGRYDEQYLMKYNNNIYDIDLRFFYKFTNTNYIYICITGESEFIDLYIQEIKKKCKNIKLIAVTNFSMK